MYWYCKGVDYQQQMYGVEMPDAWLGWRERVFTFVAAFNMGPRKGRKAGRYCVKGYD